MPATVLCARATALIDHGPHSYGANQSWWCPGFGQVPITVKAEGSWPPELPVEHEIFSGGVYKIDHDFAWYHLPSEQFRQIDISDTVIQHAGRLVVRYDKVARYEAPAPEVKEPTGLGAVVRDNVGRTWIRVDYDNTPWYSDGYGFSLWLSSIVQPVTVLSEGVEL